MSNVCCKEVKGWCKSFTRTELALALLEGVLLLVFIGFLVFIILHLVACSRTSSPGLDVVPTTTPPSSTSSSDSTQPSPADNHTHEGDGGGTTHTTLGPDVECTWKPSMKTTPTIRYYKDGSTSTLPRQTSESALLPAADVEALVRADASDGEAAGGPVLALLRPRSPDPAFGCVLTAVSAHWALTAASCLDAIEETDSLDDYVMMEARGALRQGVLHAVADVRVHPLYRGANLSYDLAALRSDDDLAVRPADLPTMLDYSAITLGERLSILGYGPFRTEVKRVSERGVRRAYVYAVGGGWCAGGVAGEAQWAARHLRGGGRVGAVGCARAPLCCGVLWARGAPCQYCAGTPLLRGRTLLGLMADSRPCGVACEPALYVNIAAARDWLDAILDDDDAE